MNGYDVIVVGVGAMGSAACSHLARRGARVLGLERDTIPTVRGSSHGQSRMIRCAYYEHPDYVPLLLRSWELWEELNETSGRTCLVPTGGLYAGPAGCELVEASIEAARLHGLDHERLDHAAMRERFPQFELPEHFTGMYEPKAGFLVPEWCIEAHVDAARRHGADVREGVAVRDWSVEDDSVVVTTTDGDFRAAHLVLCAGAWMPSLANIAPRFVPTRQPLVWVRPTEPDSLALGTLPCWAVDRAEGGLHYGFPMRSGLPGPDGFKLAVHAAGPPIDPEADRDPRPGDEDDSLAFIDAHLPAARGPVEAVGICMYTNTDDEHFIIDRHPEYPQVTVAGGFSGHGFKMASVVGEIVADLALDGRTDHPIGFLGLHRFD
mgnify:FL=1